MSNVAELLQDSKVREQYAKLPESMRIAFDWRARWLMKAHKFQLEPIGTDWGLSLIHI